MPSARAGGWVGESKRDAEMCASARAEGPFRPTPADVRVCVRLFVCERACVCVCECCCVRACALACSCVRSVCARACDQCARVCALSAMCAALTSLVGCAAAPSPEDRSTRESPTACKSASKSKSKPKPKPKHPQTQSKANAAVVGSAAATPIVRRCAPCPPRRLACAATSGRGGAPSTLTRTTVCRGPTSTRLGVL